MAVLPRDELRALFDEKMQNNEVFRAVIEILTSDELRQLIANVKNSEALLPLFEEIESHGIHHEKIREYIHALVGQ